MQRLPNLIAQKEYELSCLKLLTEILSSGDCNVCKKIKDCEHVPKIGQISRFNCPMFEKIEEVKPDEQKAQ